MGGYQLSPTGHLGQIAVLKALRVEQFRGGSTRVVGSSRSYSRSWENLKEQTGTDWLPIGQDGWREAAGQNKGECLQVGQAPLWFFQGETRACHEMLVPD